MLAAVVRDLFLGTRPPLLTVAFSGLGQQSSEWVRDIGFLVRQVRAAASMERGLTASITSRKALVDRGT